MANICQVERKGKGARYAWEVRYRDSQTRDRTQTFRTMVEAVDFAEALEIDMNRDFLGPRLGVKPFGDWTEEWLEAHSTQIKPRQGRLCRRLSPLRWTVARSDAKPMAHHFADKNAFADNNPISVSADLWIPSLTVT